MGSITITPINLGLGNHTLIISLVDSSGYVVNASKTVQVNPDPRLTIVENATVTDQGIPILLNVNYSGGTPPYTLTWSTGTSSTAYLFYGEPGLHNVTVTLRDGTGYVVNKTVSLQVNPKLNVSLSLSLLNQFLGEVALGKTSISGGTPPYTLTWIVDGKIEGSNSSLNLALTPGSHNITVIVKDSIGAIAERTEIVNVGYGYILLLVPLATVGVIIAWMLRRR
ncbi:hypothetical protein [Metallosphaera hakonensis]|uniref:PKD domain-containing protein n=1 Tax=Metallosphaera hakonensis JCM 8857 = DSM 7519 TaxID=1293036 RepID=A0A2U9IRR1_9CREN|nr:hypothetical protein [Metallosphaera hakonensis]AWR98677.1 hypothetical protein DFR87_01995 [Metallosphaera hakonensis JCM 8857 = DSM 7519]